MSVADPRALSRKNRLAVFLALVVPSLAAHGGECDEHQAEDEKLRGERSDQVVIVGNGMPHFVLARDFDDDGFDDILFPHGSRRAVSIAYNRWDGTFTDPVLVASAPGHFAAAEDLDGDGDLDLLTAVQFGSEVTVLRSQPRGQLWLTETFPTGRVPRAATIADFNADRFPDFATTNETDDTLTLYQGDGTGAFGGRRDLFVGAGPAGIGHGDFDDDGEVDLAVAHLRSEDLWIFLGDGAGDFPRGVSHPAPGRLDFLDVGDADGDGDLDLFVSSSLDGFVAVFSNHGSGTFTLTERVNVKRPNSVHAADVNQDGALDVLVTELSPAYRLRVYFGRGDGTLLEPTVFAVGRSPRYADTADFDRDGDVDIVVANRDSADLSVLYNDSGALFSVEDFLDSICTEVDFRRVSLPSTKSFVERETRYVVPLPGATGLDATLFLNVARYASVREFLQSVFPALFGDLKVHRYNALVERRATREYHAGMIRQVELDGEVVYACSVDVDRNRLSELPRYEEVDGLLASLEEVFRLGPLGYLPLTWEEHEAATAWADVSFPIFVVEEMFPSRKEPLPEPPSPEPPPVVGTPTFEVEIPEGTVVCGTFSTASAGHGVRQEYSRKARAVLRSGSIPLLTTAETFAGELFAEVQLGAGQEVAGSFGDGSFHVVSVLDADGTATFRFTYSETFALVDGRVLELALVSPLQFRARGDEPLDGRRVLTEEYFTRRVGAEALQATVDGVPFVRFGSCTYSTLPLYETLVELEDGASLRFVERLHEAESDLETAPASLVRAEVEIGGGRRVVTDYWRLVYSAFRHNTMPTYWALWGAPRFQMAGVDGGVTGIEFFAGDPPAVPPRAAYLAGALRPALRVGVRSVKRQEVVGPLSPSFLRGDVDADGRLALLDALTLLNRLFAGGRELPCEKSADFDDRGDLGLLDALGLLNFLFANGPPARPPAEACGEDPTEDGLGCVAFAPCE